MAPPKGRDRLTDDKRIFLERLHVLLLAGAIAALAWAWRFEAPPPELVDDLAAAAGLRPML